MDVDKILEGLKKKYASEEITDIDGVKIDFKDGWVHLRKSNTEPIIRIYSESKDESAANQLAEDVIKVAKSLYWWIKKEPRKRLLFRSILFSWIIVWYHVLQMFLINDHTSS